MKKIIYTKNAPEPIGPYSQATMHGNLLFVSGQIAINPATGELIMDSIEAETQQVMRNLEAILNECNMTFDHVLKCSIFLSDMGNFAKVNAVYGEYFKSNPPARETVEVSCLPKNVNVEISLLAAK
jgi:2-iminobutanoate/2-iminopropanoate deaminase